MTREGLVSRGIIEEYKPGVYDQQLDDRPAHLLHKLEAKLAFLQGIAEKELAGEQITTGESDTVQAIGYWLEWMAAASADVEPFIGCPGVLEPKQEPAAVIADVANGFVNMDGMCEILEVGIGHVNAIYVITPASDGGWQVARGAVFSYYEFPSRERLTDEAWRELLASGEAPDQPEWTTSFTSP